MESYEVQAKSKLGWQIVGVFDEYERAQESALRLDQDGIYDDLRITREYEDPQTGRFRATVVYRCGRQIRNEVAREEEEKEKLAAVEKRQHRLNREIVPHPTRWSDKERARRDSPAHPLRLAFWTALLFSAGMAALYYFEFVLIKY
jgi:hypothetical protein